MARKQHSLIGTRTTRKDRFRAGTSTQVWRPCNSTTDFDGGRLAFSRLPTCQRSRRPSSLPSRYAVLCRACGRVAGRSLRLSRPPRVGSASEATPVPEGLPQPGQPAEFEPESEAAAYGRSVGREELQIPDRFRYWSPRTATLGVYRWPRSRSAEGGTRPRLRGSWRGADPSQPLVPRSHSRSIPATCTLAAGSSRGR